MMSVPKRLVKNIISSFGAGLGPAMSRCWQFGIIASSSTAAVSSTNPRVSKLGETAPRRRHQKETQVSKLCGREGGRLGGGEEVQAKTG